MCLHYSICIDVRQCVKKKIQDRYVENWRLTSLPLGSGWKACRPAARKRRVQCEGRRYGLPWEHKDAVPLGRQYNGECTQIPLNSCWPEAVKLRLAAVRVPPTTVFLYRRNDCMLMGSHEHLPEKKGLIASKCVTIQYSGQWIPLS